MNRLDVLSWLIALAAVAAIVGGAFVTLAVLRPEAVEFESTDVSDVAWGRDFHLTDQAASQRRRRGSCAPRSVRMTST